MVHSFACNSDIQIIVKIIEELIKVAVSEQSIIKILNGKMENLFCTLWYGGWCLNLDYKFRL